MNDNTPGASSFETGPSQPPGAQRSGDLITTPEGQAALSLASPFAPPATQDVINGGMDASSLMHALRRRWPLAIGMGLLAGVLGAGLLWSLFPESATAYKLFLVSSGDGSILDSRIEVNASEFSIYRQTQSYLMTSPQVLETALRENDLGGLSFFKGVEEKDRVRYLQEEFAVQFPQGSEVMEVRLSGAAPSEELKQIVASVAKAYLDEVQFKEDIRSKKPRDILSESYRDIETDINNKTSDYYAMLEDSGNPLMYKSGDPEDIALRGELGSIEKDISKLTSDLLAYRMQYEMTKRKYEDPSVLEQRIQAALASDQKYQALEQRKLAYELQAEDAAAATKSVPSIVKQHQRLAGNYAQRMAAYRQELEAAMKKQHRTEPDPFIKGLTSDMMIAQGSLGRQIQGKQARKEEILEKLRERGKVDTDLLARAARLDGLKEVQSAIARRIEHWDIELKRPKRVQPIGELNHVDTSDGINKFQRYAISGMGGLACLGLTAFGLSYLEFRNRKLNGPDQIDQGLGIRVIGTLPSLSGRKSLNPNHPVVAQLSESIDSVRTALMHESTTRRRQIVLVTSPSTLEGRTTVASQLAASLARAGRRTLLIDGDLRHPALHSLFDLPLEDGLCEVLRAESEVADAIRPTHAEGLWVLTAGYCDTDAIHALATDQVQPIFEKLRAEYDFVIIDGAPVLGVSDSLLFGQHCDGALLSVLRDHTKLPDIHKSSELLRNVGIRLIGSVVNGMSGKADRRITALQAVTAKSERKQLENAEA